MERTGPFSSFRTKKESEFTVLFRPHIKSLYQSAYRWTFNPHDAEDLVQDLALVLVSRVAEMATIDRLRPWMLKIMYRRFVDLHRRQIANPVIAEHKLGSDSSNIVDILVSERETPAGQFALARQRKSIQRELDRLDVSQRVVVMLFDVEGFTIKEIANIVDIPEGTVKSRLHRAHAQLKNSIPKGTFF